MGKKINRETFINRVFIRSRFNKNGAANVG